MPDDMLDGLTAIQNDGEQIEGQQPGSQPVIENNGDTAGAAPGTDDQAAKKRSEEHTSELQSLMRISYAVFCLKKKKHTQNIHTNENNNTNITTHPTCTKSKQRR